VPVTTAYDRCTTTTYALVLDGLGAATHGLIGHDYADSFTGSYSEGWKAVYTSSHTAEVYFAAGNVTNLNSAAHPEVITRVPVLKANPVSVLLFAAVGVFYL